MCFAKSISPLFMHTTTTQFFLRHCKLNLVEMPIVKSNNRAIPNVFKIHFSEQIPIKDMHLFACIMGIKNTYKYELAKYMTKICNLMLPKEITVEYEYTSLYHNFHTRQLNSKTRIIPLCKSVNNAILFIEALSYDIAFRKTSNRPYIHQIISTAPLFNIICNASWYYIHICFIQTRQLLVVVCDWFNVSTVVRCGSVFVSLLHLVCCTSCVLLFCVCFCFSLR